jgi:Fe-S-cluster containining protein
MANSETGGVVAARLVLIMSARRERQKRERGRRPAPGDNRSPSPALSGLQQVLYDAGRAAEHIVTTFLSRAAPAAELTEMTAQAHRLALHTIQQSPLAARHACRPGCAFCCHTAVTVAPPEVFAIAHYLRDRLSADALGELRARLDPNAELAAALPRADYIARLIPCALLTTDGNCRVHPVRPLACAGFLSTSQEKCAAEFTRAPNRDLVPTDKFGAAAALCVAVGLRDGCRAAQRDGNSYELHHALRRVLDTPDAPERWARGENVFAGCLT